MESKHSEFEWKYRVSTLVIFLQRNSANGIIYIQKEIYCKELAHEIVDTDKSKICRVGRQVGDSERLMLPFKSEGCLLENPPLLRGGLVLLFYSGLHPLAPNGVISAQIHPFKC